MISAKLGHYTCTVNLLGHAGDLQEAENMIKAMPGKPCVAAYKALLGVCRVHGNVEKGECVATDSCIAAQRCHGLCATIKHYTSACNRHLSENVERQRKERGVNKQPGHTLIEVNNEVHRFVVDDQDHTQMIEICTELKKLSGLMQGYVLYTKLVLHDTEEEESMFHLCHQSKRLAIAFGLINITPGTQLQIIKFCRFVKTVATRQSSLQNSWENNRGEECQSLSSILRMAFVLAWTIGGVNSLSCRSLQWIWYSRVDMV
jgi:hypothetical protein